MEFKKKLIISSVIDCPWPPSISSIECGAIDKEMCIYNNIYKEKVFKPVGMELILACASLENNLPNVKPLNDHQQLMVRRMMFRPLSYPIVFSFFSRFKNFDFRNIDSEKFVTMLTGKISVARNGDVFSVPDKDGTQVMFPEADLSKLWINRIEWLIRESGLDAITQAIVAYGIITLLHPFDNGNGRLARAFFHGILHKGGNYYCPFLPLDFTYSLMAIEAVSALRQLSMDGDWNRFRNFFICVLETCLQHNRDFLGYMA